MRIRGGHRIRISAQDEFYTSPGCRVPGNICTISGRYLYDLGTTSISNTWAQYQAITQSQIETHLRDDFLPQAIGVRANTRGTMILDMEGDASDDPNLKSHPKDLHTLSDANKAIVIAEWKKRIAAVRAVFPYARLSIYGCPTPQTRGDPLNATWIDRVAALVQAGGAGYNGVGAAFDGLDALSPNLFNRYGPSDADINWNSYDDQADTCCAGAKTIKKSDGSDLPLMVYINTYVANGSSVHNGQLIFDLPTADPLGSTWGQMFPKFRDHGVQEVFVWNGINSRYARDGDGATSTPLSKFIHAGKGWG